MGKPKFVIWEPAGSGGVGVKVQDFLFAIKLLDILCNYSIDMRIRKNTWLMAERGNECMEKLHQNGISESEVYTLDLSL